MIHVTLIERDQSPRLVGKFIARKEAFREAKRAAGLNPAFVEKGPLEFGYRGPNGMAWIVE